jgi:two-component system, OmpR family, phosphate regulon sensor histidine kinase PhoR
VISQTGIVLADTEANPEEMENHSTRPEFLAALNHEIGSNTRRSHTLGIEFLYVAAPIQGGAVRLAYPLAEIASATAEVDRMLAKVSGITLLVAALLAASASHLIARRLQRIMTFAERIAAGDLTARVDESSSDEIAQVAAALDRTAKTLEANFTELHRSRGELEALLNSMQDAVIAVSAEREVLWINGAMQRLLNGRVRIGSALLDYIRDPDLLSATYAALNGESANAIAHAIAPGAVFQISAAPMPKNSAVLVLHDISAIERVEKTRRDFIANVSHELRTPLTSIQGYAETLLENNNANRENPNHREFLEIIRRNAGRMSRLTEDLLTLARVESGEQKLSLAPVQVSELICDACSSLSGIARERGVDLLAGDVSDAVVSADRDAIQQVFNNLIENAIKYAAAGGRILLGAHEAEDSVEFYVRDFGPGISSEHLPRLFERFYRIDKARSRESGGTGLGLAIVKHIILNHGGNVRAESRLLQGTTFYFTLPLAHSAVAPT